jgi:TolB-like protein/Tfp pilus assembly protein PilF
VNLFAELKRRNVIRMAGLYLVGAWLLVQVASTLFPVFAVPDWALRALVTTLAVAFIPAMVFAWVFELTPDGIKREDEIVADPARVAHTAQRMNRWIVAVLALALVYFCVDKFVLAPRRDAALVVATTHTAKAEAATEAVTEARRKALDNSIAVLPFVNMSQDKDNQFFSDGISEELLNVLVRVEGLSVASRTSSFGYRDTTLGTQAIGRELNVSHVLEGSVRKTGNKVRITAQLIDAEHDRHLWSKTYDRDLTDIFAIQDEIANAIVDAFRDTMAANAAGAVVKVHADTENMQAYELYLKAREKFIARDDLAESVRLFERAVALDPKFARGWEGLAAVASVAPSWNLRDRDYPALAARAADRALQLDPSLSMPWAVKAQNLAQTLPIDFDLVLAHYDKAIAADPKNTTAFLWRAITWMELGYFQRSIADTERCLATEPGYGNCTRHKALNLLFLGKEAEAIELFNRGITATSDGSRSDTFVAPLLARGDRTAAVMLLREAEPEFRRTVLQALDHPERPVADVAKFIERHANTWAWGGDARMALWLGDYPLVAELTHKGTAPVVAWERYPASFRNSAGMKRLLEKMGVPAYWRVHGFPPQCRPAAGKDFSCD